MLVSHSPVSVLLTHSSPTTYVLEEDEPTSLEPIDYSEESNDEYVGPENDQFSEVHENPDRQDPLSDL